MAANQDAAVRKQQGKRTGPFECRYAMLMSYLDLQAQYNNHKTALQTLAQKVGEIEQEIEEHKYVTIPRWLRKPSALGSEA